MKKRLFYTILLGIGIVFVPYWWGHFIETHFIQDTYHPAWGEWCLGILALALIAAILGALFTAIRDGIPEIIHWIKYGNK